ncbi:MULTISPECIES: response regulator [Pandoraea]|uniref:response regulator transcription factor n=1 Tax=Pandoraea TaxID=93217 RepID=UPI001F5D5102|nr:MULTISPECIES: response regulator [Pandoraea]MCI3204286.1 DNA-binding response regulator [Pandoraea sp. LA3]MDN4582312.1 DNA-binding response regulator [Pandoraea capi]
MNECRDSVVHVVDDDASMRAALSRLLCASGYHTKEYASAGEFLVSEPDARPGCVLLDLELGGPSGLDLQRALRRQDSSLPVVFMSGYSDVARSVEAMKGGAVDFLIKPFGRDALVGAVETAISLAHAKSPPGETLSGDTDSTLSGRERVVLQGISKGLRNKQIAAELGLCERTIKSCRADLMRKLGASSLAELLRNAERRAPEANLQAS